MSYDEMFLRDMRRELEKARGKFPGNEHQAAAMTQEAGEAIKALLQHTHEGGDPKECYKECVQAAAMALRVAVEGGHSYAYDLEAIVAGREDEVPDGSKVERLPAPAALKGSAPRQMWGSDVALVREADLAGLEAAYLRQRDMATEWCKRAGEWEIQANRLNKTLKQIHSAFPDATASDEENEAVEVAEKELARFDERRAQLQASGATPDPQADLDSRYLEAHQIERRQSPVRLQHDDGRMEEGLALVREADLAGLEERAARQEAELEDHRIQSDAPIETYHMLREELGLGPEHSLVDHVHKIKGERDKLNEERDMFAQRATLFQIRAEKVEADWDYLLDALKRANSLAFQAYTAASRANEGIQRWLDDYPDHSGSILEDSACSDETNARVTYQVPHEDFGWEGI